MVNKNLRLLVVSNNVFSRTKNNGKTLFSFFDNISNDQVRQLYFSNETPTISGFRYYKISDSDIIKGLLYHKKRGKIIDIVDEKNVEKNTNMKKKGNFKRLLREILWHNKWKSNKLLSWLDDFKPNAIFFVGGDCCFAYRIYDYICKRYSIENSSLYITDDYIAKRSKESWFGMFRRKLIKKRIDCSLKNTKFFFTISEPMKHLYFELFHRDSSLLLNMSYSLRNNSYFKNDNSIRMIYAGSLYYGRDNILGKLSKAISQYQNINKDIAVSLDIYTNDVVSKSQKENIIDGKHTTIKGHLPFEKLIVELNKASILVFVESFDAIYLEKIKYSLSTKVPEYLSLEKPIFSIGPALCGSMEYLKDVSISCNSGDDIYEKLELLLNNQELQHSLAKKAYMKYLSHNDKSNIQAKFYKFIFGDSYENSTY